MIPRARRPRRSTAGALALLAGLILPGALAPGCASGRAGGIEGSIGYCESAGAKGRAGLLVGVTTRESERDLTYVPPEQVARLLDELEEAGLFELAGHAEAPAKPPPGSIVVKTGARTFFVKLGDLRGNDEGKVFSRAVYRIVAATQEGPHYELKR